MKRLQFSLRTLLIFVTVLAVPCWWVGDQYRFVKTRERYIAEHPNAMGHFLEPNESAPEIPWVRKLFGDQSQSHVIVWEPVSDEAMTQVQILFPESQLYRHEHDGDYWVNPWPTGK